MPFALASEYDRLTPEQQSRVTEILIDDGDWTEEQIAEAVAKACGIAPRPSAVEEHFQDDWSQG